jgi:hypothetical protein
MIDAAHEAVSFDDYWTIDGRRDFQKAVRGTIRRRGQSNAEERSQTLVLTVQDPKAFP